MILALLPLAVETSLGGHRGPIRLNVLAAAGPSVALAWARRRPLPGALTLFVVAIAQTAFLTPLPPTVSWLMPAVVITFLLGRQRSIRAAQVGFAVALVGLATVILVTPSSQRALAGAVPGAVIELSAWMNRRTSPEHSFRLMVVCTLA